MRIAILTQYYPPEIGAPQARLSDLARRLAAAGHEIHVVTATPSYPLGRRYPGYGTLIRTTEEDGVHVTRVWALPLRGNNAFLRLATYLSFCITGLGAGIASLPRVDFLLTESPPLFLGPTGYVLAKLKRGKWIFNVSDLWAESAVRLGALREGLAYSLLQRLERFCYRRASLVTGQTTEIVNGVVAVCPSARTYRLTNGVDPSVFSPDFRSEGLHDMLANGGTTLVLYVGLHGLAQGLDQIVNAANRLRDTEDVVFVMVGDGPMKKNLVRRANALGLKNLHFVDPIRYAEVPELVASADIALVPLANDLPGAIPSKLYEAMAVGVPVIFCGGGEAAALVRSADAGVALAPGDTAGLTEAIRDLSADSTKRKRLGDNGRAAVMASFDRAAIAASFIERLRQL